MGEHVKYMNVVSLITTHRRFKTNKPFLPHCRPISLLSVDVISDVMPLKHDPFESERFESTIFQKLYAIISQKIMYGTKLLLPLNEK